MKLRKIYILFIGLLGIALLMGNSNGRADGTNNGNTGAPGDQTLSNGNPRTCQSCHATDANTQVSLDINLLDPAGATISDYIPGQTYDVSIVLNSSGSTTPAGYGFQALSLVDSDESDVAGWSEPSSNVKIISANGGRSYAEQNGISTDNTFNFKWTAPTDGSGSITFYSCGNGVNDNGATSGDGAACTTLTIGEGFGVSTKEVANTLNLEIFPNPVNEILNVRFDVVLGGTYTVKMYNSIGQLVQTKVQDAYTGENMIQLNCAELAQGIHMLRLENEDNVLTRKVYVD